MTRLRCAILDDYLDLTLQLADWPKIEDRVDITVFDQPFASPEAAAGALRDFEIICAMRERTPFPRALFAALPRLKLLITLGSAHRPATYGATERPSGGPVGSEGGPEPRRGPEDGPVRGTPPPYRPRE